jgi:hypothetical protein
VKNHVSPSGSPTDKERYPPQCIVPNNAFVAEWKAFPEE